MLQVLFRIPMTVAGVPLWVVALVVGLAVALALWMLSRRVSVAETADSLRMASKGGVILAAGAAAGAYYAQSKDWFPEGIPIYGFGMMLFFAFILCTWLGAVRGEHQGISKETIQDLAIWIFAGGLLGARLCFLLTERSLPNTSKGWTDWLAAVPKIWDGGIVLYGAIIGGLVTYFVAYFLIFRKRGVQTRRLADVVAPAIALGILLGRLGCFLNGCCFGGVTCTECQLAPGVGFPLSAPPRELLVSQGYQSAAGFSVEGTTVTAKVARVDPASGAYRAGLRSGMTITAVDGSEVTSGEGIIGEMRRIWPVIPEEDEVKFDLTVLPAEGAERVTFRMTAKAPLSPQLATAGFTLATRERVSRVEAGSPRKRPASARA